MRIRLPDSDTTPSIDMVPMLDTVFNLLIFFLVATTFAQAEREVQIALPIASSAAPITAQLREMVINVQADGAFIVNGRAIAPDALAKLIDDAVAANPQQKVTVRGDRTATYQHIVNALDVCKQHGIQQPYLDTVAGP